MECSGMAAASHPEQGLGVMVAAIQIPQLCCCDGRCWGHDTEPFGSKRLKITGNAKSVRTGLVNECLFADHRGAKIGVLFARLRTSGVRRMVGALAKGDIVDDEDDLVTALLTGGGRRRD
jgi:hypothetical protein